MTCRVDFMDVAATFYRQNGNIYIIAGVTELFDHAGGKKAFCIFIDLHASPPEIADMTDEIRYETSAFKI